MEAQDNNLEPEPQPKPTYKRLWCAMASAAVPGLGDWILGDRQRSAIFLALFLAELLCYWPMRLPRSYFGLFFLSFAGCLLNLVSACCTFLLRRSGKDAARNVWILALIPLALVCVSFEAQAALRASGFQVFTLGSESMSPTIEKGDSIVVDRSYYRRRTPQPGDVVAFRHGGTYLLKRVMATGDDTIQGIDQRVEVDGHTLAEPYAVHRSADHPLGDLDDFGPYHVADGEIFVLGDNRDFSLDSRIRSGQDDYGPVFVTDIIGKPLYRFKHSIGASTYNGQPVK